VPEFRPVFVRYQSRNSVGTSDNLRFFLVSRVPSGKWWDNTLIRPRLLNSTFSQIHHSPIILKLMRYILGHRQRRKKEHIFYCITENGIKFDISVTTSAIFYRKLPVTIVITSTELQLNDDDFNLVSKIWRSSSDTTILSSWLNRASVISDTLLSNCENVELLKYIKIMKSVPTCFGLQGNHHQGVTTST
jgi:hypothetical protein